MLDLTKTYGLVFEGGGAKGAYQVGAWKALEEYNVRIEGVTGTSVGALNGALFVQNKLDEAMEIWRNIRHSNIFGLEDEEEEKFLNSLSLRDIDFQSVIYNLKKLFKDRGFDITPLKKLIEEKLDEDKIRNSNIDFGLVTVSLSDRKALELFADEIPKGLLFDFLLASSYLPVFKGEKLHGKLYLDGGFYNNVPVQMLINRGYKDIIVIKINGIGITRKVDLTGVNITEIAPEEELGSLLEFDSERARYNIELGYYDTCRAIENLKGEKYYIRCKKSEKYYINKLLNMKKKTKHKIIKKYTGQEEITYRILLEEALPILAKKMKLKKVWSYDNIIIKALENIACELELERFKIYDLEEFISIIKDNLNTYKQKTSYTPKSQDLPHIIADLAENL